MRRLKPYTEVGMRFEKAKSIWNTMLPDKLMERYDWDREAYFRQKMEEHGVDTEDEQAIRAINAMADIFNKAMDMSDNTLEGLSNAVENDAKLR
jgi:hypothetical protein